MKSLKTVDDLVDGIKEAGYQYNGTKQSVLQTTSHHFETDVEACTIKVKLTNASLSTPGTSQNTSTTKHYNISVQLGGGDFKTGFGPFEPDGHASTLTVLGELKKWFDVDKSISEIVGDVDQTLNLIRTIDAQYYKNHFKKLFDLFFTPLDPKRNKANRLANPSYGYASRAVKQIKNESPVEILSVSTLPRANYFIDQLLDTEKIKIPEDRIQSIVRSRTDQQLIRLLKSESVTFGSLQYLRLNALKSGRKRTFRETGALLDDPTPTSTVINFIFELDEDEEVSDSVIDKTKEVRKKHGLWGLGRLHPLGRYVVQQSQNIYDKILNFIFSILSHRDEYDLKKGLDMTIEEYLGQVKRHDVLVALFLYAAAYNKDIADIVVELLNQHTSFTSLQLNGFAIVEMDDQKRQDALDYVVNNINNNYLNNIFKLDTVATLILRYGTSEQLRNYFNQGKELGKYNRQSPYDIVINDDNPERGRKKIPVLADTGIKPDDENSTVVKQALKKYGWSEKEITTLLL